MPNTARRREDVLWTTEEVAARDARHRERLQAEQIAARNIQAIDAAHKREMWRIFENYAARRDAIDAEYTAKTRAAGLWLILAVVGSFFAILLIGAAAH